MTVVERPHTSLDTIIPEEFYILARAVVVSHRPTDPALNDFKPLLMAGISPDIHGMLNEKNFREDISHKARLKKLNELRVTYEGDKLALEEIDAYDPDSDYQFWNGKYIQATKANNSKLMKKYESLLTENYPLLTAKTKANFLIYRQKLFSK